MKPNSRTRRPGRPLSWLIAASLTSACLPPTTAAASDAYPNAVAPQTLTWMEALNDTACTGRPTLVVVSSSALESSLDWSVRIRRNLAARYGDRLNIAELRAESDPQRVRALNVKSIPTVLFYRNDGKGGLSLAGYLEGALPETQLLEMVDKHSQAPNRALVDQAVPSDTRRVVRVQRASVTAGSPTAPEQGLAQQPQNAPPQDAQVAATTHHQYAQSSAQSSPQNYGHEAPPKQMPPAPVKSPPNGPPQTTTTYQTSPPQQVQQPVYGALPVQTPQPVYAYVPQQQPVYAAPPSSAPVMVQPPAGQVVVQPAPLNVTVGPTPPPQVTYMAPTMAAPPMMATAVPAPNAFAGPPPVQPMMAPPAAAPEPAFAPQPAYGAPQPGPAMGYGPAPAAGLGSMAMGMMLTNPNILDRMLGGFGRLLAERSYPRIRMNPESPSLFSAPAGMGGFVGINPAMAMAPSQANPVQAYMAVPNGGGGGGDATEAYLKAYIALCKEKGITPNLPGWEPPAPPPPTGPVPSPQGTPEKKRGWLFH